MFLLHNIEDLINCLPVLINLGIFFAAVGFDVAAKASHNRQHLRTGFYMVKNMMASVFIWLSTIFGGVTDPPIREAPIHDLEGGYRIPSP